MKRSLLLNLSIDNLPYIWPSIPLVSNGLASEDKSSIAKVGLLLLVIHFSPSGDHSFQAGEDNA